MNGFIKSFLPIWKRIKKYLIEIILISLALIVALISLFLYLENSQREEEPVIESSPRTINEKIYLDIAGSVNKPGVYQLNSGSRLKDAIKIAGDLSDEADKNFFSRNFNLARIVSDQEKIYVPSVWEVNNGYNSPATGVINHAPTSNLININSATIEELDQLPGIGQTTANKIIKNRPYSNIEELLTKKVVNKGIFEKVRNLVTVN